MRPTPRIKTALVNSGVLAGTLLVILGGFETYFRHDPEYADFEKTRRRAKTEGAYERSDDRELIYVARPDYSSGDHRITTNDGIVREQPVALEKRDGERRIVVIGDSIARGDRIIAKDGPRPFPDLLEARLRSTPGYEDFVVVNFGTNGYSSIQSARLLETKAVRYDPDLIVFQFCANDFSPTANPAGYFQDHSRLFTIRALKDRLRRSGYLGPREAPRQGPTSRRMARHWRELYDRRGPGWQVIATGLERVAAVAKSRDVPAVLLVFPLLVRGGGLEVAREISTQVEEEGLRHGFEVLNLQRPFEEVDLEAVADNRYDVYHPSPFGHEVAALRLHERIVALFADRVSPASVHPAIRTSPDR